MSRLTRILVLAVLAAGCVQSPAPEPFPQEVADAWAERYAAHDAAGVAALYTEDAQLLPPNMEIISGRAAIQEFVAQSNPPGSAQLEMATTETLVIGDYAHRQGSFAISGRDGAAPATGKFIELLKKVDGNWLIHRDIWNWNASAPNPPAPDAPTDEPA